MKFSKYISKAVTPVMALFQKQHRLQSTVCASHNVPSDTINDYAIPRVLTREEVERLLDATPNLKYKAMFALMYSSGLRVSEVIHLNYEDISRTNMQIYIRNSKTHSSRYAILSKRALDILTEYWFKCGKPKGILFPNQWTEQVYQKMYIPIV